MFLLIFCFGFECFNHACVVGSGELVCNVSVEAILQGPSHPARLGKASIKKAVRKVLTPFPVPFLLFFDMHIKKL